jgi:hypothetical protein
MARLQGGFARVSAWVLVSILVVGFSALGGEGDGKGNADGKANVKAKAKAKAKAAQAALTPEAREAREILQALRELNQAVQDEGKENGKGAPGAALPARPHKTVKTPELDSAALDGLVDKYLATAKVPPARITTDEEFVRRVHLDLTGKLPTPAEMVSFARAHEKDKRAKLVEYLLNSKDYATNWSHYWRDVIRFHAANTNLAQVQYPRLEEWLTEQFEKNTPWDEIATSLIAATGRNDENGAVAFTLAQMAQPVEMAGEVSRMFLGIQIQCAQCHDHPNDPWKREQFHQFAAFFAGSRQRRAGPQEQGKVAVFEVVNQPGKPRYTMPDLKDPQKQIPITPKFFLAKNTDKLDDGLTAGQRRTLIASYITGQDNPWFAKAFVNRIWYVLMGEGFFDPVDDLGPTRTSNAPEVLDALATAWQEGGYDIKWLFRTILNTKAYQRESRASNTAAGRTPFASNCSSRLRSDQILDSLAQALNLPFSGPGPGGNAQGKAGEAPVTKAAAKKAAGPNGFQFNPRANLNILFGIDPSTPSDDVLGTIPQALFLMNGPQINRAVKAMPNTVLGELLTATPDNRVVLEALYLRVLARRPNAKEVSVCGRYVETVGDRREAFEDILWSLINSTEFLSRR